MSSLKSVRMDSPIKGTVHVPGDKSISHRALILSSIATGTSVIKGILEGDDVIRTSEALRSMGVPIKKNITKDCWIVDGVGKSGLSESSSCMDMGNSGTGVRLMMGLVAPYEFNSFFTGDESLCSRPMKRVIAPLSEMGCEFSSRSNNRLPLVVHGSKDLTPITYRLPVASAQVKSAILLAGLNISGNTTVIEPRPTRDHTERMIQYMGGSLCVESNDDGERIITVMGGGVLQSREVIVPGDPSSAAFLVVAALLVPGSELTIENVCINPERIGLYKTLQEMGGDIAFINKREQAGEEVADLRVRYSKLKGIVVPEDRAPTMIDEYPVLSIAAACAEGTTHMKGLAELKVKESNRLLAVTNGLIANNINTEMGEDDLKVHGVAGASFGGGTVVTNFDHRIAMSFLILGMVSDAPVTIDDGSYIATSYPGFVDQVKNLGANVTDVLHKAAS